MKEVESLETPQFLVNIPLERVGVLIGKNGSVKKMIEERLGVELEIDSHSGSVKIALAKPIEEGGDPVALFKARDIIEAIGRGFSPERAFRLFSETGMLKIIRIDDYVKPTRNNLMRVRARLIGSEGKTRKIIEETTDTYISIYGDTVAIIGENEEDVRAAEEAIVSLINGAPHTSVYRMLNEYSRMRKLRFVRR
ncbi:MAG: KH domain-containing protein [Nitrososphaerota archaeon]|nr:KH domain-containing protein [Candidatus Geocrenenecus dongiae]